MPDGAITIIAVVIGFLLGFGGDFLKNRLQENKRTQSVRMLVRLELQKNIDGMSVFWAKVQELPPNVGLDPFEQTFLERKLFCETVLPPWDRLMWESHAGSLADAYAGELNELERAYDLVRRVQPMLQARTLIQSDLNVAGVNGNRLTSRFDQLVQSKVNATGMHTFVAAPQDMISAMSQFNEQTTKAWQECESFFHELARGNPLADDRKRLPPMRSITHRSRQTSKAMSAPEFLRRANKKSPSGQRMRTGNGQ